MSIEKKCFFNAERPCDLTCKAAFEVDDPVDNVDCHFVWVAYQLGEGLLELKRLMETFGGLGPLGGPPGGEGEGPPGGGFGAGPKKGKGLPNN